MRSRGAAELAGLAMLGPPRGQGWLQMGGEAIEAVAPESAVEVEPFGRFFEGPPLRRQRRCWPSRWRVMSDAVSSTLRWRDTAGSEIVERRRQLVDRGLAERKAGENGAARRIGKRGEGVVEVGHVI